MTRDVVTEAAMPHERLERGSILREGSATADRHRCFPAVTFSVDSGS